MPLSTEPIPKLTSLSDAELWSLIEPNLGKINGNARKFHVDEDELRQEVCLELLLTLDKYDSSRASFDTWFSLKAFQCAYKMARSKKSLQKRTQPLYTYSQVEGKEDINPEVESKWAKDNLSEEMDKVVQFIQIIELVEHLNLIDQEIIHFKMSGFSTREIAEELEISIPNVRQRFSRALRRIRSQIQQE